MPKKDVTVKTDATTASEILAAADTAKEAAQEKSVSDVIPSAAFYPDLSKMELRDIQDVTHRLLDVTIREDFESDYGTHDLALLLVEDLLTGEQYTTACSGIVVLKKLKKLIELKALPILATFTMPGKYWDII